MAVLREIHRFDVVAARIASLDADVAELLCGVHGELLDVLFPAGGAHQSPIAPLGRAQGTDERTLRAITFLPQHADLGFPRAIRADVRRADDGGVLGMVGKILRIRLQKNPGQKLFGLRS